MVRLFALVMTLAPFYTAAQFVTRLDTITVKQDQPVYTETIASDLFSSSFLIVIEKEVPAHFHKLHTEYVYIVSGTAELTLDTTVYMISPGNLIYIPQATAHSVWVTSDEALRVLSIQSPEFKGKDRYFLRPITKRSDEEGRY